MNKRWAGYYAVFEYKREHGTVVGLPGTETVTNEDLLLLECDILIPAALGNQFMPKMQIRLKQNYW